MTTMAALLRKWWVKYFAKEHDVTRPSSQGGTAIQTDSLFILTLLPHCLNIEHMLAGDLFVW